ncbi:hypothetical protein T484DRAFT_1856184 [Baffinella frigidus]|nr:hypothetical protein T484DRAFT_1856184 [Cryptophyta sp. CCMP2293]
MSLRAVLLLAFAAQAHAFVVPALPRVAGARSQARGLGIAMRSSGTPLLGGGTGPASMMQRSRSSSLVQLRSSAADATPPVQEIDKRKLTLWFAATCAQASALLNHLA